MPSLDTSLPEHLPLREPTFFILLSLASGEKHGYAIIKTVEKLSRGKLKMSTGTLYEGLARLVEQEFIERVDGGSAWAPVEEIAASGSDPTVQEQDQRSRTRKAYRLTQLGRRILAAETARMRELVSIAQRELGNELS
jgi:DNA-binding PadR family transcriptional regulator